LPLPELANQPRTHPQNSGISTPAYCASKSFLVGFFLFSFQHGPMDKRRLGKSGMVVSEICLGTMTYGSNCNEKESFAILNHAFENGIDFYDTAEIYPVPPKQDWMHESERIVGNWLSTKERANVIIASKVTGPGHGWFAPPLRGGLTAVDRLQIKRACEASLQRLQTDYIDLYQVHWPDHDFGYEETLTALTELAQEGKIRAFGSSNETPWGTMRAQATAEHLGSMRYETIQNNFSILNRRFEDALADICRREKISLLPYSPIGGGVLSGKYNNQQFPEGARFTTYLKEGERQRKMIERFVNDKTLGTTEEVMRIAAEAGMSAVTLSVAWSKQHDYVASTIIGANSIAQLDESLKAADLKLPRDVLKAIDAIAEKYPYPMG
jgi:aryl-alcohol dehydrogenase-like predicted oxidoreductase